MHVIRKITQSLQLEIHLPIGKTSRPFHFRFQMAS